MTRRVVNASVILISAACIYTESCVDQIGGSTPSDTPVISAADRAYAEAYCALLERCAADFGRRWVDEATCYQSQIAVLLGPEYEIWNPDADDAEILACVDYLDGALCGDFYDQAEFRWTPPCDALFDPERRSVAGVGRRPAQPTVECGACEEGYYCIPQPELGPVCRTCVAGAKLGESCRDVPCVEDVGLVCDRDRTETCVEAVGFSCTSDFLCGSRDYYCDDVLGCQPRRIGTPCERDGLVDADTGEALVCIDGVAAPPSNLDGPCEDSLDCALPSLTCLGDTCQPRHKRGEACTEEVFTRLGGVGAGSLSGLGGIGSLSDSTCEGDLICSGGVCDDRPALDEACGGFCQLPLLCLDGVCRALPAGPPVPGDPCSFGLGGALGPSADATGYCDPESGRWSDFLNPGDPCDGLSSAVACGPDAYCESGRCTKYAHIGAACAQTRCHPSEAYCDLDAGCRPLEPPGAMCGDFDQCDGAECLGACIGGEYDGLPCTAAWQCGAGECAGTCRTDRDSWSACGG